MTLSAVDFFVFAVYIVVVLGLGLYASRRAGITKRDYFLAGDKLPWWVIGGSIVAANISSHHFVGVMGVAYSRGFVAMAIEWPAVIIGFNALLWVFLPFYLRNGFYTMPEYLERRFGGGARATYGVLIFLIYVFVEISAVLYLGALSLNTLLGWPILPCIAVLALMTGVYTISGGLRAVVWTEMLQLVVLMSGGAILSFMTIRYVGGWRAVMATSGDWHLILPANDPDFPWTMFIGASLSISVFYCATNQFIVQRCLAAKDEWHARMGVIFTDYLKLLIPLIIIVPGLMAVQIFPNLEKPDFVFPRLVEKLLPPGLVGLVMAGLIAAIMSHISGALNSCTTMATIDFYLPYINRKATDAQAVRFGRVVGAATIIFAMYWANIMIAHSDRPVFIYLLNAYGYFTPGITTMFLLGILWKRATHKGVLTAAALSVPISIALDLIFPKLGFMNRTGIAFWLCMAIGALASLCTTPKPAAELEGLVWNKESLTLPNEQRHLMRGWRNPVIWWAIVTAIVLALYTYYGFMRYPG